MYAGGQKRINLTAFSFHPEVSDGIPLGSPAKPWSDLYLASGGNLDFISSSVSDVKITHATNQLSFTGATTNGYRFGDGPICPSSNDGISLGTTALKFSDLFLASGAVINFNSGDVTLTHSADTLTLGGGNLALGTNSLTAGTITGNNLVSNNDLYYGSAIIIDMEDKSLNDNSEYPVITFYETAPILVQDYTSVASPVEGMISFDYSNHKPVFYDGSGWYYYDGSSV
jgi:hypothetical protein